MCMPRFPGGLIMRSSIGITKIAAFRFMLLLHLFLKVKMCVGFVDAAAVAAGDSDINYDDSDEWVEEKARTWPSWSAPPSVPSVPAPASLMRWDGPDSPRGHSGHSPRMHHVRHEQHYLKHGPVQLSGRVGTGSGGVEAPEPGPYHAHTVTTTTVTGPQQNPQRHAPDQAHHRKQQHHHSHHHHHHQQHESHHHHHPQPKPQSRSPVGVYVSQTGGKRDWHVPPASKEVANGLSAWRGSRSPQEVVSRKPVTVAARDAPVSPNALFDNGSSRDNAEKTSMRSSNLHGQKYFEDLLTEYKRRSPYYKELHHARGPQTKALAASRGKSRGSADATKKATAKVPENDYDYLYDDETDEDVQNDASYAGEGATSTRAPTTTTTRTTTTRKSSTTARSGKSVSGEDDESAGGDSSYSAYLKNAYAMQSNPARRGNNRFSNLPTAAPAKNNQHGRHGMANQVRQPDDYPPLTRYKLANFGTQEAVERSYKTILGKQDHINSQQVMSHIQRINSEGSCRVPRLKVVPASSDRTKNYSPPCTILHRCDADAGCCMDTEVCAPKVTSTVQLYFYEGNIRSKSKQVVALSFTNHTECHCVEKGRRLQGTSGSSSLPDSSASGEGTGGDVSACRCPDLFRPIFDSDSQCYCDCVSSARDCIRFKEGLEHFPMQQRQKISSGQLKVPTCEYGTYRGIDGRCPTKGEGMDPHFSRYR